MTYDFTWTEEQLNVILAGLGELPAKISLPIIIKIQQTAQEKMKENQKEKAR